MMKKDAAGSRVLKYVTAGAAAGVLLFSSLVPRLIPLTAERKTAEKPGRQKKPDVRENRTAGQSLFRKAELSGRRWKKDPLRKREPQKRTAAKRLQRRGEGADVRRRTGSMELPARKACPRR